MAQSIENTFASNYNIQVLTESRIPLKPVLGAMRTDGLSISFWIESIKPSLLFSYIVGSVFFWRIRFFQIIFDKSHEGIFWIHFKHILTESGFNLFMCYLQPEVLSDM